MFEKLATININFLLLRLGSPPKLDLQTLSLYQTRPNLTKLLLKYMHWFGMVKLGNWIHPSNPMLKTAKIGLTMQWAAVKL